MKRVKCDYCGDNAVLVNGETIYPHRKDLYNLQFWQCQPCSAFVGCHKNSDAKPLGRLANADLRRAKKDAHAAFDPLWKSGKKTRKEAYRWLSQRLEISGELCHIGMFDIFMCHMVMKVCRDLTH